MVGISGCGGAVWSASRKLLEPALFTGEPSKYADDAVPDRKRRSHHSHGLLRIHERTRFEWCEKSGFGPSAWRMLPKSASNRRQRQVWKTAFRKLKMKVF